MATARFIHDGNAIDHTPGSDLAAGSVVVQGDLIGITKRDIASGQLGTLELTGVFDLPKATGVGEAIGAGAYVYWDEANQQATTTSTSNKLIGKTVAAAGDDDETVRVRLSQ